MHLGERTSVYVISMAICLSVLLAMTYISEMRQKKAEDNIQSLEQDIKTLKSEVTVLDIVNYGLEEENHELYITIQFMGKSLEEMQEDQDSLVKTVSNLKDDNDKLEKDLKEAKKKAKALKVASTKEISKEDKKPKGAKIMVVATAYTAYCEGCSGTTYTGINLIENPQAKVIAVDPKVIPLGSKVHVEGYGDAIAGDIGGDIKGSRIDLFMPVRADALEWGRKEVQVTIKEQN